jgi:FkbM family methyltransferase
VASRPDGGPDERRYIAALGLEAATVIDVGARCGDMTLLFAERVGPSGRLVAYEPHPENLELLRQEVGHLPNVTIRPLALADAQGELTFAYPELRAWGSAEPALRDAYLAAGAERLTLPATTLDAEVEEGHAPLPDLVKIDVEGLELAVIRGMDRVLSERAPQLLIEIHGIDRPAKIANAAAVLEALEARGYESHHIEADRAVSSATAEVAAEGHLHASVP